MNIYFNLFNNSIILYEKAVGKEPEFFFEKDFDYPISKKDNVSKAITELISLKECEILKTAKTVNIITGDDIVGFGLFNLPQISPFKVNDVISTRFKLNFPDFDKYYFTYSLFEKKHEENTYFYSFANKEVVNTYSDIFEKNGIHITNVDYYANSFPNVAKGANFPVARLFIGKDISEVVIYKGDLVVSIYKIDYGYEELSREDIYLDSGYNKDNEDALKYASFIKANFASKELVNDDSILKEDPTGALNFSKPRELRVMKEDSLGAYRKKNNIRKYCSVVFDVIDFYSSSPWFLPIKDIETYCEPELLESLSAFASKYEYNFIKGDNSLLDTYKNDITSNKLFKSKLKGERKKIDWGKILSMEIGGKKKKA